MSGLPLFAPFARADGWLLAVSGGPDSMALLHMAAVEARHSPSLRLFVATVDHRLRPDSGAEAALVARFCADLDVGHATLPWTGDKPATRLQERARVARYALLCAHAKAQGCDILMTGHHADDQAETILFRLLRGSGIEGLAGMALESTRETLRHGRPLLALTKVALEAYCMQNAVPFVRDPSNGDERFARVRMRALLPQLAEQGLGRDALLRLGRRAQRARAALLSAEQGIQVAVERRATSAVIDARALADLPDEFVLRILAREIERLGCRPRLEKLECLLASFRAARPPWTRTLGGTRLALRAGALVIERENPRSRVDDESNARARRTENNGPSLGKVGERA